VPLPIVRDSKFPAFASLNGVQAFLIIVSSHFFAAYCAGADYQSDGSARSVQTLHRRVSNGDTIVLPAGIFAWSTPVTISKAIKLQGAGSGRIIGNTKSSVTIGTGPKTFITTRVIPRITPGQVLKVAKMPSREGSGEPARNAYMQGKVVSYSGTTLVLDVTEIGASGTWTFWWIATQPMTTIVNNYDNGHPNNPTSPAMLTLSNVEVSGIQFVASSTSVSPIMAIYGGNQKAIVHDCWFSMGLGSNGSAIYAGTNDVLVYQCSFDDTMRKSGGEGIVPKLAKPDAVKSWSTNSTMGMNDTTGRTNFYIEDCDFHACNQSFDAYDGARVVFRHNIQDNSQASTHGQDGGPTGSRHIEFYDNELIFDAFSTPQCNAQLSLNRMFWLRGGTGIFTDNVLPRLSAPCLGTKANIDLSVINTRRKVGPYCCWVGYPCPHQIGQGYGPGAVFHAHTGCGASGNADYYIYAEPLYIWNNSGTGGNAVSLNEDPTDQCGKGQHVADYVQAGRDYKLEAKPGYVKFTYPHPLRSPLSPHQRTPGATPTAAPGSPHKHYQNKKRQKKTRRGKWPRAKKNSANEMTEMAFPISGVVRSRHVEESPRRPFHLDRAAPELNTRSDCVGGFFVILA
jgi:hypothetical protein